MLESRLQSWRGEPRAITGSLQLAVPSEAQAAWALVEWGVPTTEKGFLPALHHKDPEPLHADAVTGRPHTENPSVSQSFTDTFVNTGERKWTS